MKKLFRNQRKNEEGSVLLAVIAIMTFATILAATAFTFTRTASDRSYENVNEKQAYYTATTCLETFVESVLTPNNANWESFLVIAENGAVSQPVDLDGMGTCTIKVEKPAGLEYVKITSTAEVNGREDIVVCYLKAITEPGAAIFENAVELTGSANAAYNNINVLGDMAGSNDSEADMVYTFTNRPVISGQYFQYGSFYIGNQMEFKESIRGNGSSLTASKYIYLGANDFNITSSVKKQNNSDANYIYAGNTFASAANHVYIGKDSDVDSETGTKPGDIDLFAAGIIIDPTSAADSQTEYSKTIANDFVRLKNINSAFALASTDIAHYNQYGNIYCFANGETNTAGETDGVLAGNLIVDDKGRAVITGDVYVEGNLYISPQAEFTVYGNIYVKGDIIGTPRVYADSKRTDETGFIYCTSYSASSPADNHRTLDADRFEAFKTGRGKVPSSEYEGTKFIYHAEDIMVSDDENVSTISSTYKAMTQNKDAYRVSTLGFTGGDFEGKHYDLIITSSCYIRKTDNWGGSDLSNYKNILVQVTNGDIVIAFEDGITLTNNTRIFVKNTTKSLENSDSGKPNFCYFLVDTYEDGAKVEPVYKLDENGDKVLDRNGKPIVIDSNHSGFKQGATLTFNTDCCIIDYDTWKNANVGNIPGCGTLPLNLTGTEVAGSYTPENDKGYIIMLLSEGTTLKANNCMMLETTIYGRQAHLDINNGYDVNFEKGTPSYSLQATHNTAILGSCVVGNLTTQNAIWIAYMPPSSKSNLANLGGAGADQVLGYEVVKYTQNLS